MPVHQKDERAFFVLLFLVLIVKTYPGNSSTIIYLKMNSKPVFNSNNLAYKSLINHLFLKFLIMKPLLNKY